MEVFSTGPPSWCAQVMEYSTQTKNQNHGWMDKETQLRHIVAWADTDSKAEEQVMGLTGFQSWWMKQTACYHSGEKGWEKTIYLLVWLNVPKNLSGWIPKKLVLWVSLGTRIFIRHSFITLTLRTVWIYYILRKKIQFLEYVLPTSIMERDNSQRLRGKY